MAEGENVPLTAGMAVDEKTTLHDKAIPRRLKTADGRWFDLRESHDHHERAEFPLMQAGMTYADAHRWATEIEHFRQRSLGFDPVEIEALAAPHIDAARHRARMEGATASGRLDDTPYVDGGETDILNRPPDVDPCLYDRDGHRYLNPRQLRLLDTFDAFVGCSDADGTYAVLEPSTGMLLAHGHALDDQAVDAAKLLASRQGTIHLRRRIDAEPPLSQQQLKEMHHADQDKATGEVRSDQAEDGGRRDAAGRSENGLGQDHQLTAKKGTGTGPATEGEVT